MSLDLPLAVGGLLIVIRDRAARATVAAASDSARVDVSPT
jgi:hypothetical protein